MNDLVYVAATLPTGYRTRQQIVRKFGLAYLAQMDIELLSMTGDFGSGQIVRLKKVQARAEASNVDAANAIALIVDQTVLSIAHRIARLGQELG